jgi:twinkle protein
MAHLTCPNCPHEGSFVFYDNNQLYCFGCRLGTLDKTGPLHPLLTGAHCEALPQRGLTLETVQKFNYQVKYFAGHPIGIANYHTPSGKKIAQKLRNPQPRITTEKYLFLGPFFLVGLYGEWLWHSAAKKKVIITEGELDTLSVSQVLDHQCPVVSLPNGSGAASKHISTRLKWLNGFDEIMLCFDQDEPGQKAVNACIPLFPPDKVTVAKLPLKDASEMLQAGREQELEQALIGG